LAAYVMETRMLTRRTFTALAAGAIVAPRSLAAPAAGKTVLYASIGRELAWHEVEVETATLTRRGSVTIPSNVQYAWPHPSRRFLYVVSSSGSPGVAGENHFATAWRVDPASGALAPLGPARELPYRPIHISVDGTGRFAMLSHIEPSHVTVFHLEADGTLGAEVNQAADLDVGIYAHQLRTTPSNATAILVTRGYNASASLPERPGGL
jgi:6-phosphogluconolactonase (cycloisomerase 2 family)